MPLCYPGADTLNENNSLNLCKKCHDIELSVNSLCVGTEIVSGSWLSIKRESFAEARQEDYKNLLWLFSVYFLVLLF